MTHIDTLYAMARRGAVWMMVAATATVVGCASGTKLDDTSLASVESRTPVPTAEAAAAAAQRAAAEAAAAAAAERARLESRNLENSASSVTAEAEALAAAAARQRVVYFDYDSYVIKDDFKPMIEAHARALLAMQGKRMVVEGHTDERGGREYNLALGQKRAEAVVRALTLLGVPSERLEAVSFGQERPAVSGGDEATWAQNRRAELKDR